MIPSLVMRKLQFREVEELAQDHTITISGKARLRTFLKLLIFHISHEEKDLEWLTNLSQGYNKGLGLNSVF